jgi:hypothetical protein
VFADPCYFGVDPDPRIHTSDLKNPDPDPAIFVSDLQDINKKLFFFLKFYCILHLDGKFTSFFRDKKS